MVKNNVTAREIYVAITDNITGRAVLVEVDGRQHFLVVAYFGESQPKVVRARDTHKAYVAITAGRRRQQRPHRWHGPPPPGGRLGRAHRLGRPPGQGRPRSPGSTGLPRVYVAYIARDLSCCSAHRTDLALARDGTPAIMRADLNLIACFNWFGSIDAHLICVTDGVQFVLSRCPMAGRQWQWRPIVQC